MSEEKKYYVYVHKYASGPKQGQVFYVGKGSGSRISSTSSRSNIWKNIVKKYGKINEEVARFNEEVCAFSFEMALIKYYGIENLCNLTHGGEGASGFEPSWSVEVYCSNGMKFKSVKDASNWVENTTGRSGCRRSISDCINGRQKSAFGYLWSRTEVEHGSEEVKINGRSVIRSDGLVFDNLKCAVEALISEGFERACSSKISACCLGRRMSCYGYAWSYDTSKTPNLRSLCDIVGAKKGRPVIRSDGKEFKSIASAARYMSNLGNVRSIISSISGCASGKLKTAYGYSWKYKDDLQNIRRKKGR